MYMYLQMYSVVTFCLLSSSCNHEVIEVLNELFSYQVPIKLEVLVTA